MSTPKLTSNLKFIVTGTGRCGTVYAARLLTSLGIPCGHEAIFNYESEKHARYRLFVPAKRELSDVSVRDIQKNVYYENWVDINETIADSSYLAAPHLQMPEIKDVKIIHIVRNPIDVIRSFVLDFGYFQHKTPIFHSTNLKGWEHKIYTVLPYLSELDNPLDRACYFYVEWNKLIEEKCKDKPYFFSKIEDMPNQEFFNFIDVQPQNVEINNRINTFRQEANDLNINDLKDLSCFPELENIAYRYGYNVNSNS